MQVFPVALLVVLVQCAPSEVCPHICRCTNHRYKIFCKDTNIKSLPLGSSTTTLLSMEGDILIQLNQSVISESGLRSLTTLQLVNMHIRIIQAHTFTALSKLKYLTITDNNITELHSRAFIGLEQLNKLDLSRNELTNISSGVFVGLEVLRHLNLSFNRISRIHFEMFASLRRVCNSEKSKTSSILDLSHNTICQLDDQAFQGLCFFTQLKINLCKPHSVPVNFKGLLSLQRLEIYRSGSLITMPELHNLTHLLMNYLNLPIIHNKFLEDSHLLKKLTIVNGNVENLEPRCFQGLISLSELDLSFNELSYLRKGVFQHLQSLRKLNLSYNYFEIIQESSFLGLSRLRYLDLGDNTLTLLQRNSFAHLPSLRELNFNRRDPGCYNNYDIISIQSDAFSDLFSLKALQLPYLSQQNSTHVTLESLHRLDTFEGPVHLAAKEFQVLKTLKYIISGYVVHRHIEKSLSQVIYLKQPKSLEIYDLNSLTELDLFSRFHISNLDLRNSKIHIIENNSFIGFSNLTSLKIQSASKITIQQGAFSNLKMLQYLRLDSRVGFQLDSGVFQELCVLKKFFLQNYFPSKERRIMSVLRRDFFKGLQNVKEMAIQLNGIQSLNSRNFIELENLEMLDLTGNKISNLNVGAFRGMQYLQELDLSFNNISILGVGAFDGLRRITKLLLASNKIKSIGVGVFGAICDDNFTLSCANLTQVSTFCNTSFVLETLTYFDLSNNNITFIHLQSFLGCNKLRILKLNFNYLQILDFLYTPQLRVLEYKINLNVSKITNSTFTCTTMLSSINLQHTEIPSLQLSALQHLRNLKDIALPETKCDCNLRQIWQWLRSRNIQYATPLTRYQCDGTYIDIYLSQLECNTSTEYINQPSNKNYTENEYVYFKEYIEPVVFIFIFLSGCFGNGLLLFIIFCQSDMRNKNNICVAHLAIADIMSLLLNLPLSYWDTLHVKWELGETTCKIFISSKDMVVALVTFTVLILTFERFLVVRSFNKLKFAHESSAWPTLLLVFVWIYAIATSIPSYINATVDGKCFCSPPGSNDYVQRLWTFQLLINCLLPVASIIYLNIITAYTLKKSIREMPGKIRNKSRDESRNTVVNVVAILSVVFTLSYLPNFLLRTLVSWSVWNIEDVFWYSFVTYCLFFIHTIFSPFALFVMGSKYKSHIMKYIRFFIHEKEDVHAPPDVKKAFVPACNVLQNLGKRLVVPHHEDVPVPIFPDDIAARDEAVRRARLERLKRLQVRYM